MQFVHPEPRQQFRYHIARVFIDEENRIPIRYEAYTWPKEKAANRSWLRNTLTWT